MGSKPALEYARICVKKSQNQLLNSLLGSISFCGYPLLYIRSAFVVTTCYIFVIEEPSPLKIVRKKLSERENMHYSTTKPPAKLPLLWLCNYYLILTTNKLSLPSLSLTCPTGHAVFPAIYLRLRSHIFNMSALGSSWGHHGSSRGHPGSSRGRPGSPRGYLGSYGGYLVLARVIPGVPE